MVRKDFRDMLDRNKDANGTFGALPQKIVNGFSFGGQLLLRTVFNIAVGAYGLGYTVLVPTAKVVARPVGSILVATLGGVVYPVVSYSWNGTAWVLVHRSNEPTNEGSNIMVTYTELKLSKD